MGVQNQAVDFSARSLYDIIFGTWLEYVFWFIFIWFILLLARIIIREIVHCRTFLQHKVFLVRLPKEKPGDAGKDYHVQDFREEISKAEILFASIGGLRAQRGWQAWLLGRDDHFSFEIVANKKKILFYVVAPENSARYLEQQVHAHYPEAIIEEVDDYNIFHQQASIMGGTLRTTRKYFFPIKTYQKQEADVMNSLINVMSKLDEKEGMAIQYVVRSAHSRWHRRARRIAYDVQRGKTINEAIKSNWFTRSVRFVTELFRTKHPNANQNQNQNLKKSTAMQEEMLKGIEEKNSKAGLDVNLRIVISAANAGNAYTYLNNLASVYGQFNYYEYGNSFSNKVKIGRQKELISDFIYRRFNYKHSFVLNTEELASLFHFPTRTAETPNVLWLTAKHAPAPADLPNEGIVLGTNTYRDVVKQIHFKRNDRRRHTYIIGKSGVGKSKLIAGMAIQDIINGEGVCVLDPHGDLIADIASRIPPERAEDVIYFSPSDIERPMALNLLEFDERYPEQKTFVINEIIKIFDKLYDLRATGGPIFEQYMRNAMLLIMDDPSTGSTLMEIPKVLADASFRNMKLAKCRDHTVVEFWRKEAEKAGGDAALANVVPYVTSKLTQFISNDTMRPIIGQQRSSFNMRDLMDKRKILLINLSKGAIGEMNAYLLGMILIGKILMAALSRTDMSESARKDFYLYIDEFQNFTTDSINSILSEARKYGLNLIIAHQYLGQLTDKSGNKAIRDAVFGNVGTWMLFKIGSDDAEVMEKEFSPVFNQYDLINVEKYTAYVKLLVDNTATRPFSMVPMWPLPGVEREEMLAKIKNLSRLKFGQDRRMVEAEIRQRTKGII